MATVLFDLGHPAHYHLFKHAMTALRERGHHLELLARQKDCLADLLSRDGWDFIPIAKRGEGLAALGAQSLETLSIAIDRGRKTNAALMLGTSLVVGWASRVTGATSLVFGEDDATVVRFYTKVAYSPAHYVVTPECLRFERHGRKHLTYPGYQEFAYLHPNRYQPDPTIRDALGIAPGERYFVVRLVSLTAHHDIGQKGLATHQARTIIDRLAQHGRVFISAERTVDDDLRRYLLPTPPDRILDVMASADMVVGDSQTMAAEAAVLGTPALRCNTFVGRLTYLTELEDRWGLAVGVTPNRFDLVLDQIDTWLATPGLKAEWARKRQRLGDHAIDLTAWIVDLLECLIDRRQRHRRR